MSIITLIFVKKSTKPVKRACPFNAVKSTQQFWVRTNIWFQNFTLISLLVFRSSRGMAIRRISRFQNFKATSSNVLLLIWIRDLEPTELVEMIVWRQRIFTKDLLQFFVMKN